MLNKKGCGESKMHENGWSKKHEFEVPARESVSCLGGELYHCQYNCLGGGWVSCLGGELYHCVWEVVGVVF